MAGNHIPVIKSLPVEILPGGLLPHKAHEHDAGFDLFARVEGLCTIPAGDHRLVPVGFRIALPVGYEAQIRPRSGLALNKKITVLNTPGTVDCGYRGEVGVILMNHGHHDFVFRSGERIAQMVIAAAPLFKLETVGELPPSERGTGGFGSTGT